MNKILDENTYPVKVKMSFDVHPEQIPNFINGNHELDYGLIRQEVEYSFDNFVKDFEENNGYTFYASHSVSVDFADDDEKISVELELDDLPEELKNLKSSEERNNKLDNFKQKLEELAEEKLSNVFNNVQIETEEPEVENYIEYAQMYIDPIIENRKSKFEAAIEENDYSLTDYGNNDIEEVSFELNGYAGEYDQKNVVESFETASDLSDFVEKIKEVADNYEPEEEAEIYVKNDMLGKRGVPASLSELLEVEKDAESRLEKIAEKVEEVEQSIEFEENCYEKYLESWLKDHNIADLSEALNKQEAPVTIKEFLDNEYKDPDVMIEILEEQDFRKWMQETKFAEMEVKAFPEWALNYVENGDFEGLSEDDKKLVDDWIKDSNFNNLVEVKEHYFASNPEFGLASDVVDITYTTKELNRILEKLSQKEQEKLNEFNDIVETVNNASLNVVNFHSADGRQTSYADIPISNDQAKKLHIFSKFDEGIFIDNESYNLRISLNSKNNEVKVECLRNNQPLLYELPSNIEESLKENFTNYYKNRAVEGKNVPDYVKKTLNISDSKTQNIEDNEANILNDIIKNGVATLKANNYDYDGQIDGEVFAGENERIDFDREKVDNADRFQIAANLVNYMQSKGFDQQYINEKLGINDREQEFFTNYPDNIENKIDFSDDFVNSKTLDELISISEDETLKKNIENNSNDLTNLEKLAEKYHTNLFDKDNNLKWHSIDYTTKSWLEIGDTYIEKNDAPYQLTIGQSFNDLESEYGEHIPKNLIKTFESESELDAFVCKEFNLKDHEEIREIVENQANLNKAKMNNMQIYSFVPFGYEGNLISVEADARKGIPSIDLVGLADGFVKESRERMKSAIVNSGYELPYERVLISLMPADVKKDNDMTFAMTMAVSEVAKYDLTNSDKKTPVLVIGDLSSSGKVNPTKQSYVAVRNAISSGIKHIICSKENEKEVLEAAKNDDVSILAVANLSEAIEKSKNLDNFKKIPKIENEKNTKIEFPKIDENYLSFDEIPKGYSDFVKAEAIAIAGKHHFLVVQDDKINEFGSTRLLQNIPYITPKLTTDESLKTTRIASLAGLSSENKPVVKEAPFRMPHETSSIAGICGGGSNFRPGEISLAHNGTLFLDKAQEFKSSVLQMLRVPMESKNITLSRAGRSTTYPAKFSAVMKIKPCPCGNSTHCLDSKAAKDAYLERFGKPLLDRFDVKVQFHKNPNDKTVISFETIQNKIKTAYEIQRKRGVFNEDFTPSDILKYCKMEDSAKEFLQKTANSQNFSPRQFSNSQKVALTIANMDGREIINEKDMKQSLSFQNYEIRPTISNEKEFKESLRNEINNHPEKSILENMAVVQKFCANTEILKDISTKLEKNPVFKDVTESMLKKNPNEINKKMEKALKDFVTETDQKIEKSNVGIER